MSTQAVRPEIRVSRLVVVASPSPLLRQGLEQLPRVDHTLVHAGGCGRKQELFATLARVQPDVVLLDVDLPGMADLELLRDLLSRYPDLGVVILLAAGVEDMYLGRAVAAGAKGFVLRDASPSLVAKALCAVAAGRSWLQRELTEKLFHDHTRAATSAPSAFEALLSPRQSQVLGLVAQGLPNREVAHHLSISEKTVKAHLTAIFRKLGVTNRYRAIHLALSSELTRPALG